MIIKKIVKQSDRAVVLVGTAVLPKEPSGVNWEVLIGHISASPYFKDKTVIIECEPIKSRGEIAEIVEGVRERTTNLIVYYTTKSYEYLRVYEQGLLKVIDILIDGQITELSKSVPFRFSTNQRIIDVVASAESGKLIYHKLDVEL